MVLYNALVICKFRSLMRLLVDEEKMAASIEIEGGCCWRNKKHTHYTHVETVPIHGHKDPFVLRIQRCQNRGKDH